MRVDLGRGMNSDQEVDDDDPSGAKLEEIR